MNGIKNSTTKKITPTDLRNQAEQLLRDGNMPSLQQLLAVVVETRQKYAAKILEARHDASTNSD